LKLARATKRDSLKLVSQSVQTPDLPGIGDEEDDEQHQQREVIEF
jgi:hypothetical protein